MCNLSYGLIQKGEERGETKKEIINKILEKGYTLTQVADMLDISIEKIESYCIAS